MSSRDFEDAYEQLRRDGHNTVENLVKWLRDARILERTQTTEEEAYQMFMEADRQANVTLHEFQSVISNLGEDSNETMEKMTEELAREATTLATALAAAAKTFAETIEREEMRRRRAEDVRRDEEPRRRNRAIEYRVDEDSRNRGEGRIENNNTTVCRSDCRGGAFNCMIL